MSRRINPWPLVVGGVLLALLWLEPLDLLLLQWLRSSFLLSFVFPLIIIIAFVASGLGKIKVSSDQLDEFLAWLFILGIIGSTLFFRFHLSGVEQKLSKLAADPFQSLIPQLVALGRATQGKMPLYSADSVGAGRKTVWVNLNEEAVHNDFWKLNEEVRAVSPDDIDRVAFSQRSFIRVGEYSFNSGVGYREMLTVWIVDYRSKAVIRRTVFSADPPKRHYGNKNEYGKVPLSSVISWIEEP